MRDPLANNLASVREEIRHACEAAGRDVDSVILVCVTKYAEWDWVQGLYELGERHFGESRPQQLAERTPRLPNDVCWHLIGSLQSNKARVAVQHANIIHSIDSTKLLERVDRIAGEEGVSPALFLQINVSEESAKHGWSVDSFAAETPTHTACEHARLVGLMTMAPRVDSPENARPFFAKLRELRDTVAPECPALSMGMSGDFQQAICEGATHVRVGSRLFAGL